MKKLVLKILSIIGATGASIGSGFGLLVLYAKILGSKLTDEYADEHPVLSTIFTVGGLIVIVLIPGFLIIDTIWKAEQRIEKKIDNMRDDKHIDMTEEDEFEQ